MSRSPSPPVPASRFLNLLRPGVSDDHWLAADVLPNVVSIVGEAAITLNVVPSYTFVAPFPPQATNRRLVEASIVHALRLVHALGLLQIRNRLHALAGFQIDDLERVIGNGGSKEPLA